MEGGATVGLHETLLFAAPYLTTKLDGDRLSGNIAECALKSEALPLLHSIP